MCFENVALQCLQWMNTKGTKKLMEKVMRTMSITMKITTTMRAKAKENNVEGETNNPIFSPSRKTVMI